MPLQPLEDRIVIRPISPESTTPGGIVLPDIAQEKPQKGIILAVGPGRQLPSGTISPMTLKIGDMILHSKHLGIDVIQNGVAVKIMRESEVLAVLVDADAEADDAWMDVSVKGEILDESPRQQSAVHGRSKRK